ncbi:HutD family protein [Castellaniella sp.]|uniref:HutD/Ves family protein n=1 Tax=Castellaniella sp. TaxID=1955812 RepID=UPI002AFFD1E1|nr:HutD family protein [Castellaniella sp.]
MQDIIRLIPAADLLPVPWKNGGGVTRQIAIFPVDASPDDFIWRVSVADLAADGPFSHWDDMDRILMLIRGGPVCLTRTDSGQETRLDTGTRLYFAGETPYMAVLTDGPAQDFNLMLRRKQAHGCVDMRSSRQKLTLRPGETILHCVQGQFQTSLPPHLGGQRLLNAGDTLHITLDYVPFFGLELTPLTADARLVDARINLYPTT